MVEGICDYKRLKGMLKESDQKWDKDLIRVENSLARVDGRVDATLEEIKSLINGMTLQNNDLKNQINQ